MAASGSDRLSCQRMNLSIILFITFSILLILSVAIRPADGKDTSPKPNPKNPKDRKAILKEQAQEKNLVKEELQPEDKTKEEVHEEMRETKPKAKKHKTNEETENETDGKKSKSKQKDSDTGPELKPMKKVKQVLVDSGGKGKGFKLGDHPSCASDAAELCGHVSKGNNFVMLTCLQDNAMADDDKVTDGCQEVLWEYKLNLTKDPRFDKASTELCRKSIKKLENCNKNFEPDGSLVNCLIEHRELVEDNKCRNFLQKMSAIVFSDYRLIKGFYQSCVNDVKQFKCARLTDDKENDDLHKQGEVIECLEEHIDKLSPQCKQQVNRVAELSSDDYHMDRALYYACQGARERFCGKVQSGEGQIYKCLMKHKDEETMTSECQERLRVREKLMAENVKVNHPLWEHCHKEYEEYECTKAKTASGKAAHLLLCLNNAIAEGKTVNAQCQAEMQDFGAQLFQDYKLNPQVVADCEIELDKHCKQEFKPDGGALDCLMGLMKEKDKEKQLSQKCYKAVHDVLKETGAGTHYKIDRPLYVACDSVIESLCKDKKEALVLGCLMDHIYSDMMTPVCQKEIYHLQYFLARDFSLDENLYKDCKADAEKLCSAPSFKEDNLSMPPGVIMSCLYRATLKNVEKDHRVSKKCGSHIKRVMHQRANSVKLMPEIEEPCMKELGDICLEHTKEGEEIDCLQQNFEKLSDQCRSAISNFTEMESEDMGLDKDLVQACAPMVAKFCQNIVDEGKTENVLPCLLESKNKAGMDPKCQVAVEHWQLIEMKDFKFSHKLKKACYDDVMKNCESEETKFQAVRCLSEIVRHDTMKDLKQRISKTCRDQIHEELKIQSEDIQLNPEFLKSCENDLKQWCKDAAFGQAEAEECLRTKKIQLSKGCKDHLFQEELKESEDNELDYKLMHVCKPMIKVFCNDEPPSEILRCLRKYKNDIQMDAPCRAIIFERQVEESKEFVLDPDLSEFCEKDVQRHCNGLQDKGRGEILQCLKKQISAETLQPECEDFVRTREEEAALDYRLDPALEDACRSEVKRLCNGVDPGRGKVVECLKKNLRNIMGKDCKTQIKRLLDEGEEDIHADPPLKAACEDDIGSYCGKRRRGHGSVVNCLMDVYNSKTLQLEGLCKRFLKERIQLWNYAGTSVHFKSLSDIALAVHASPERNYIYLVSGCLLGILFFGGLCFGRVTKRVSQSYKDR